MLMLVVFAACVYGLLLVLLYMVVNNKALTASAELKRRVTISKNNYYLVPERRYLRSGLFKYSSILNHVVDTLAFMDIVIDIYFFQTPGNILEFTVVMSEANADTMKSIMSAAGKVEQLIADDCVKIAGISEEQVHINYVSSELVNTAILKQHSLIFSRRKWPYI